jgi:CheY-like chemotaxis protein
MRVVIVEDDDWKREQLTMVVEAAMVNPTIIIARSVNSGLAADLVLLDMSLPSFEGAGQGRGRPQGFGGREILAQLHLRCLSVPVILVTQYGQFEEGDRVRTITEVNAELVVRFSPNYRGYVLFTADTTGWQTELRRLIDLTTPEAVSSHCDNRSND